jgi:integrase
LRLGELFELKWKMLTLDNANVRIIRFIVDRVAGEPKTTGSKRALPLPVMAIEALKAWRVGDAILR